MFERRVIEDINKSVKSLGAQSKYVAGFADRLVRQYGVARVIKAVDMSELSPLQAGWVKRWIQDTKVLNTASKRLPGR